MTLPPASVRAQLEALGVPAAKIDRVAPRALPPVAAPAQDPDGMNKTERRRALELEALRRTGAIAAWAFGSVTLLLADRCRYTPDFLVATPDGRIAFEEVKGFWRDDALVKIKVAARLYPMFTFTALRPRKGGGWDVEGFG